MNSEKSLNRHLGAISKAEELHAPRHNPQDDFKSGGGVSGRCFDNAKPKTKWIIEILVSLDCGGRSSPP